MKKNLVLTLAALACLSLAGVKTNQPLTSSINHIHRAEGEQDTFTWPAVGTSDPTSPMGSIWMGDQYGFKRIGDTATAVSGNPGWGKRCDYGNRTFTADDFEISFDLSNYQKNDVLMFMLTGARGSYVNEATCQLNMDILTCPEANRPHDYMVTLNRAQSKNEAHNYSIAGWNNTTENWLDSYNGVLVHAEDDTLVIKFKSVSDTKVKVCVNEVEIELDKSVVFETLADKFYLGFGTGFNAGEKHFIINHVYDKTDRAYYNEETGVYYKVKKSAADFIKEVQNTKLEKISDFVNVFNKSLTISFDGLYGYDSKYLHTDFDAAVNTLKASAIEKFGNDAFIELFKSYADKLHANIELLSDEAKLQEAMEASDQAKEMIATINSLTLTEDQQTNFDNALAQYNNDVKAMNTKAKELYVASVDEVIAKMNAAKDATSVAEANVAYNSLGTTYRSFIDADALAEIDAKLDAARTAFLTKFKAETNDKMTVSGTSYVIHGENDLGLVTSDKGIIFSKEQYDVADFSFTYDMKSKGAYSIALMDNAEFFNNDDAPSVADHKGLIFLIRPKNDTTAYVETYMIDGSCNRFFDGQLSQTSFDIPLTGEINFSMQIVTTGTSGVYDNYLSFTFNGKSYEQPLLKAQSLLGAFEDKMGYLSIGAMNASQKDPMIVDIKNINGITMEKDSYRKTVDYAPKSTVTTFDFKKGSTSNINLPINPMLSSVKAVTMDDNKLDSKNYSYTRNSTLTLKATYLNTLATGAHKLKVETENGFVEINCNITEDKQEPTTPTTDKPTTGDDTGKGDTPTKKGCGGSVVAGASIIATLALASTALFLKKKKEDR